MMQHLYHDRHYLGPVNSVSVTESLLCNNKCPVETKSLYNADTCVPHVVNNSDYLVTNQAESVHNSVGECVHTA